MREKEPIVVKFRPLCRRYVSLRVKPVFLGSGDVADGPSLQDVVDAKNLILLEFAAKLDITEVLHRRLVERAFVRISVGVDQGSLNNCTCVMMMHESRPSGKIVRVPICFGDISFG